MADRREFLRLMTGAVASAAIQPNAVVVAEDLSEGLIPRAHSGAPNYWCTWAAQNYLYGQGVKELDVRTLEDAAGASRARDLLSERCVLGPHGWAKTLYSQARSELYLLLDDGWEEGGTASFRLDQDKFPTFSGPPKERLRGLNSAVRAEGWRSLALWCRNPPGGASDRQCVSWSKFADIPYLKVDQGDRSGSLARARSTERASITLEHIHHDGCVNGDWLVDGRFGAQPWDSERLQILRNTDVYRAYDATAILGVPTTLDRAAQLLIGASGHPEAKALLNVEDEVYIAAVLGCTMGVMRHPLRGLRGPNDPDVFFPPIRRLKQRLDEVARSLRWQRIAPAYAVGVGGLVVDTQALTDEWIFAPGETFERDLVGRRVRQAAPARIARNMELPIVTIDGPPPYVACARFPNGAAAIGAFERVSVKQNAFQPRAHVRWVVGDAPGPFGVFGRFASLTLDLGRRRGTRVLAQDLAGRSPVDITATVASAQSEITLSGELIDCIGRSSSTPGDLSMPALVLVA